MDFFLVYTVPTIPSYSTNNAIALLWFFPTLATKIHQSNPIRTEQNPLSPPRQRRLRPPLKRQVSNRITRIPDVDGFPRLVIVRQLLHINHDLVVRQAAIVHADLIHGGVDVVHAGGIGRLGGATVVLGQPEAHDALGARVGPVPLADGGGGVVDGGAGVEDDGVAVVPGDVEAGAVVEEEGAVGGGGGDPRDGAVARVVGGDGVLDEGAAGVDSVCRREDGGEEEEDEEFERGSIPHVAVFVCICSPVFETGGIHCQGLVFVDVRGK